RAGSSSKGTRPTWPSGSRPGAWPTPTRPPRTWPPCCAPRHVSGSCQPPVAGLGCWSKPLTPCGGLMEENRARDLLETERAERQNLLAGAAEAGREDRETEDEQAHEDASDSAQPLTAEGEDDAIAESLRDRLAKLDRALKRLDDGTYGRSVRSGVPIPDERLEADPAAELTVEEARNSA